MGVVVLGGVIQVGCRCAIQLFGRAADWLENPEPDFRMWKNIDVLVASTTIKDEANA